MEGQDLGKTKTGMTPQLAVLLSYMLGFITGILFYILEKDNKYVRFHAMQSILIAGGLFVVTIILGFIPVIGWILIPIINIVGFILWIILMIKAFQGEKFKLPVIGDIAEKNA